jgi:nucleoside-diphosphate-sugar epimerase
MISKAMKLILTGTSGFIGSEVLSQALRHPSITSIVALSRKPIPNSDPKLKIVIVDDFEHYSPSVLSDLSGAEACIWYVFPLFPLFSSHDLHATGPLVQNPLIQKLPAKSH